MKGKVGFDPIPLRPGPSALAGNVPLDEFHPIPRSGKLLPASGSNLRESSLIHRFRRFPDPTLLDGSLLQRMGWTSIFLVTESR